MARKKRPEWLRKLARLGHIRKCEGWPKASRWAVKYKTFEAAWKALEDFSWLLGVVMALDPDAEKYECADTLKALQFKVAPQDPASRCAAFRKLWPGIPRAINKLLRKVTL